MHERPDDPGLLHRELVSLLELDFSAGRSREAASDSALGRVLSRAVSTEEIDARLASPKNRGLGERVGALVAGAAVTESFKHYIAHEVRQAEAWRRPVDETVSPAALGIDTGEGIFDPDQAQGIEANVLRRSLFNLIHRFQLRLDPGYETERPLMLRSPTIRPSDFNQAADRLLGWQADFTRTYRADAFAGLTAEDYAAAAPRVDASAYPDAEAWIEALIRLRDYRSPN